MIKVFEEKLKKSQELNDNYENVKKYIKNCEKDISIQKRNELNEAYPEIKKQANKVVLVSFFGLGLLFLSMILYLSSIIVFITKGFNAFCIVSFIALAMMLISRQLAKSVKKPGDELKELVTEKKEGFVFSDELQEEIYEIEEMKSILNNLINEQKSSFEIEKEMKEIQEDISSMKNTADLSKRIASIGSIICIIMAVYNANYTLAAIFAGVTIVYLLGIDIYKNIKLKKLNNQLNELK